MTLAPRNGEETVLNKEVNMNKKKSRSGINLNILFYL